MQPTPLAPGQTFGPYELLSPIGAGGMGEVWKARDTRLDRIVAMKFSKQQFSERFEREARAIAQLNHPHICTLYDVGPDYLVMEYVEGAPLAGPLPFDKVIEYTRQTCEALDAAHRKGITHRDLKPANIMVTRQGIKLLDFGLARFAPRARSADETVTAALTKDNTILGTLQYMSPEQLNGKPADGRGDIFSLGLVIYEIVTGRRAFEAESQASLIAAIMKDEPRPMSELAPLTPPSLEAVVRTCLAKNPEDRWQSAREVTIALRTLDVAIPAGNVRIVRGGSRWWAAGCAAAIVAFAALAIVHFREKPPESGVTRFPLIPPPGVHAGDFAMSPDSRKVVFGGTDEKGVLQLWIRNLETLDSQPVPGTQGGAYPFWSPDSKSLGFFAQGKLKKIDLATNAVLSLADAPMPSPSSGTWGSQGTIVFDGAGASPLFQVPAEGGPMRPATSFSKVRGDSSHIAPRFLPDGKRFLYYSRSDKPENAGTWAGSVEGGEPVLVLRGNSSAEFVPAADTSQGYLMFVTEGNLLAQAFDPGRLRLAGEPRLVAERVRGANGRSMSSGSPQTLVFATGGGDGSEWGIVSRDGKPAERWKFPHFLTRPRVSPDGKFILFGGAGGQGFWLRDVDRGTMTKVVDQVTRGGAEFTSGGSHFAYRGSGGIWLRPLFGGAQPTMISGPGAGRFFSLSSDGKVVVGMSATGLTAARVGKDETRKELKDHALGARSPEFSPDGRWLAYTAGDQTHLLQCYIVSGSLIEG